jgi:hypothetical protein
MIRSILKVSPWLAAGSVLLAGLYWLFLNTPESNQLTLTASAGLVLLMVAVAAIAVNGAVFISQGASLFSAARRGVLGAHWFVIAAIPVVVVWIVTRRGDAWLTAHSGEISAWFIATLGWADVSPLFRIESWVSRWLRWVVFPLAALSLLSALLNRGVAGVGESGWIRRAWSWRTLLLATATCGMLLALPWQLTAWRPALPPTWVEPTAAGIRLGIAGILILIGCALMVTLGAAGHQTRRLTSESPNPSGSDQ